MYWGDAESLVKKKTNSFSKLSKPKNCTLTNCLLYDLYTENRASRANTYVCQSDHVALLLHRALSLAAKCIVIGPVCISSGRALFVCVSVTTITRNCVHRSSPDCRVCRWRFLQLIKFWPSRAPRKGVCGRTKFFGSALLQPASSVCVSPNAFLLLFF